MALYEWIGFLYFVALTALAWAAPMRAGRLRASAAGAAMATLVVANAYLAPLAVRAWVAHVYLVAGYWLPALLVPSAPNSRFEAWLLRSDAGLRKVIPPVPAILAGVMELAYLACYPLVPVSFSVVWLYGSAADVERFWTAVLLSGYACYATLPWLVSRPPRLVGGDRADSRRGIAGMNALVLGRLSHQFNTFPSGHVAVSAAATVIVASVSGIAGAAVGAVTAAICVGAASGRYHYVIDVLLGLGVAAAAVAIAGIV